MPDMSMFSDYDPTTAHIINDNPLDHDDDFNWAYLFDPSEWYVTSDMLTDNYMSLLACSGAIAIAALWFIVLRFRCEQTVWWKGLRRAKRVRIPDGYLALIWLLCYIPLGLSSWLVWVYGGEEWNRSLTIYAMHMAVNVLFPLSLYLVNDISLALLNLYILIGVAMFTTNQFNLVLRFASYINTPYLLFLAAYAVQLTHFWWLNDGQEMMEAMKAVQSGKATFKDLLNGTIPTSAGAQFDTDGKRRRRKAQIPEDKMARLQRRVKKQREGREKSE